MSSIKNLNHLELKAMRQSLGLTVAEASDLKGVQVSKRFFNYLEAGDYVIKPDVADTFFNLSAQYQLALHCLTRDIAAYKEKHYPQTDNADEYFLAIKDKTLVLPFFHKFELFEEKTGNELPHFWKIYQSIVGHLLLIGEITTLDDNAEIPLDFSIWQWLEMKYDG